MNEDRAASCWPRKMKSFKEIGLFNGGTLCRNVKDHEEEKP